MKLAVTTLSFCVAALLALGMVMLYSASMCDEINHTQVGAHYLIKQLIWGGMGLVACFIAAVLDYRLLKKCAWPIFGFALVLLILVLIPHIGQHDLGYKTNGARRWFNFGGVRFQPSELAKIALIIAVAAYGEHYQRKMATFKRGILIPGIFIGTMLLLIIREPDFGCTMLLAAVTGLMLLLAGVRWSYILPPVLIAGTILAVVIWKDPMRSERVYSWMHLEETKTDKGHQAYQAMLAFGSGGWTGLGLGNGRQKLGFIPEHHTDFILSIIGEELGLVATLLVVSAFLVVVWCGIYIAYRARDTFGLLLASGLTLLIGLQAAINIGVVSGALPNKGLPLPFISYGGSNLLAMLTCIGILLSVARGARISEDFAEAPVGAGEVQTA